MPSIFITLLGITGGAVVREVQPKNVSSISVTLFGIVGAVVREWQPQNVSDIFVTLLGIVGAAVRDVQL